MNVYDKTEQRDEYQDIVTELKDLQEKKENEKEAATERTHAKEEDTLFRKESYEAQLEAVKADVEQCEEMADEDLKQAPYGDR